MMDNRNERQLEAFRLGNYWDREIYEIFRSNRGDYGKTSEELGLTRADIRFIVQPFLRQVGHAKG